MTKLNINDIAGLNKFARTWGISRDDVVIRHARDGEARPAPGWFDPAKTEVVIDTDANLVDPRTMAGLLAHEGSHAIWSNWLTPDIRDRVTPAELSVLMVLEEARIERLAVNRVKQSRSWIRATFRTLLGDNFSKPEAFIGVGSAISNWALVWGRVHGGIVYFDEAEAVDNLMRERFGDFYMDVFDDLLAEYGTLNHGTITKPKLSGRAIKIAKDWVTLVQDLQASEDDSVDAEDDLTSTGGTPDLEQMVDADDGDDADDTGDDAGDEGGSTGDDDADDGDDADGESATGDDDATTAKHAESKGGEQPPEATVFDEVVDSVVDDATRTTPVERTKRRSAEAAKAWTPEAVNSESLSCLAMGYGFRAPTPDLRRLVTNTARRLEQDATPAVTRTRVSSELPPGRIRGRAAMQQAADRAGGRMSKAQPWAATRRAHQDRAPVIIGVATDVSGSMGWAQELVGEFTYVMAQASQRVNARFAAVTFGDEALGVVGPGETLDRVPFRPANGGTEEADHAIAALDAKLRLTDSDVIGRKLLIVVSDSALVKAGEFERMQLWADAFGDDVDVVWVGVNEGYGYWSNMPDNWEAAPASHSTKELLDSTLDRLRAMSRRTKKVRA